MAVGNSWYDSSNLTQGLPNIVAHGELRPVRVSDARELMMRDPDPCIGFLFRCYSVPDPPPLPRLRADRRGARSARAIRVDPRLQKLARGDCQLGDRRDANLAQFSPAISSINSIGPAPLSAGQWLKRNHDSGLVDVAGLHTAAD